MVPKFLSYIFLLCLALLHGVSIGPNLGYGMQSLKTVVTFGFLAAE